MDLHDNSSGRWRERPYMLLVGVAVAALAWVWQFDAVPPDMVDNVAAAAGLRPPAKPVSFLWHLLAMPFLRLFGVAAGETVLRVAGHVSLGVLAAVAWALLGMLLPASFRRGEHVAGWWRAAVRIVLFQGVALFCLADPVWNAFRWFSPAALQTLLAIAATMLYLVHFRTGSRRPLFASFGILGLLISDTPVGAVLLALAVIGICARQRLRELGFVTVPDENPLFYLFISWRLTIALVIGMFAGGVLESMSFVAMDGLDAFGWTYGEFVGKSPLLSLKDLLATCSPAGAVVFIVMAALPVVVEARLVRRATDDEKQLRYFHGLIFFLCGITAFTQLAGVKPLWAWTWAGECIRDGFLKCIASFLSALAFTWSLAVFTFGLWLRNFRRVETLRSQDDAESDGATEAFAVLRRMQRFVRECLLLVEPLVVLACVVPFRAQRLERAMLGVVADAARETAAECGSARYLFTDGGLDASVEVAAAERGGCLYTLSLMGHPAEPRDVYLRTRCVADAEDRELLESGAPDVLRTWVRSRPERIEDYAVQIGFELWRRDGRPIPECAGLVGRPAGFAPGEAERGAAVGRELAKRIIALYGAGSPGSITDRALRDAFLFAQWRLAVIARHRANAYDGRGERALAVEETSLADALDRHNGALARIRATMTWASRKKLERMTPQEGLRRGLSRADFALARVFALRVLEFAPDDPEANFALGMDFFVQRQYARAQEYLERCLVRRPDDPAVLNNLAQCRLRQGDPAGALPYAKRALEILPDTPEVRRTMERVKAAMTAPPKNPPGSR